MRLLFQGTVPKVVEFPGDNEDAAAVDIAAGRIALSDGASESYDSKTWSNLLVGHFLRDTRLGPAWVQRATSEFSRRVRRDELSWSKQASFDRGSFASLLGVRWDASTATVDLWCIGDTLVALLDGSAFVKCLPYTESGEFKQRPQLLCTDRARNPFVDRSDFRAAMHHRWQVADLLEPVLICMTDGLAEWALRESANRTGVWEELGAIATTEALAQLVVRERLAHNMRVDDVTLVIAALDPERRG